MLVTQLCLTLCDPMDGSPPGSSVHGILQARILEWVAILFSREIPDPEIKPNSVKKFSILSSQIKNLSPSFSPFITFVAKYALYQVLTTYN